MERHAMAVEIKEGRMNEFRKKLGEIWEELVKWPDKNGVKNFSIWNAENLIFVYGEWQYGGGYRIDDEIRQIVLRISDTFTCISEPGKDMRLMYHNFGILRESKELIRHRVFMTRLHKGCEEEYKCRHDELISQRGDTIDPGPDSNFSIWSAGGIYSAMMRLILQWKRKRQRKNGKERLHGRCASLRLWTGLQMMWIG